MPNDRVAAVLSLAVGATNAEQRKRSLVSHFWAPPLIRAVATLE